MSMRMYLLLMLSCGIEATPCKPNLFRGLLCCLNIHASFLLLDLGGYVCAMLPWTYFVHIKKRISKWLLGNNIWIFLICLMDVVSLIAFHYPSLTETKRNGHCKHHNPSCGILRRLAPRSRYASIISLCHVLCLHQHRNPLSNLVVFWTVEKRITTVRLP